MKAHLKLIAVLLVAACSEGPIEPKAGSLTVSTTTTGGDRDEDGYSLSIDSDRKVALGPQATVVIPDLSAGTHVLELSGVADNCSLAAGTLSRPVTVEAAAIARVEFGVTCDVTGIQIMTRTTGADLPPGGYGVTSGNQYANVATNGLIVVSRLHPGSHTVSLSVGDNCSVVGGNSVTVSVSNRTVTPLTFEIVCVRVDGLGETVITADPVHGWPASVTHVLVGGTVTWLADGVSWAGVPHQTIWIIDKNYQFLEQLPLRDGRATKMFETRGTFTYCSGGCWDPPDFGVVQVH